MSVLHLLAGTELSEVLGWALIHSLWEGAVIALVLAALTFSVRSARFRYVAACAALITMAAGFALTMVYLLPDLSGGAVTSSKVPVPHWDRLPIISQGFAGSSYLTALIPWMAPLWMVGVCCFYLRYALACLSVHHMRSRGVIQAADNWQSYVNYAAIELKIWRPVTLLETLIADTPVVLGYLRPAILTPLGFLVSLPPSQVEAILLHELAHIKRADYLMNICQRLIEGLLFYHPAVWWISHVIRTERENCCDDMVVKYRGNAHGYAVALTALEQIRLEQRKPIRDLFAPAATGGNLMKRIKRLLYPKRSGGMGSTFLAVIVLIAGSAVVMATGHGNAVSLLGQAVSKVEGPWQNWLNEDVVYIISEKERAEFAALKTDEERQQFVERFWMQRDPTPGTPENEFKEEHYRRIAYANDHWAKHAPGWKSDRGRIYIVYGPPDEIDSHPSGGNFNRPESEGGGVVMTYPFEDWRYSHFQNIGSLTIEFIDKASNGDFRMTLDPNEKYKQPR